MGKIIDDIPRDYWEDEKWADEHITVLAGDFPNQWVAIFRKGVIASGKSMESVTKIGREKAGGRMVPVVFAEKGGHIYAN